MKTSVRSRFQVSPTKSINTLEPAGDTGILYPVNSVITNGEYTVKVVGEPSFKWVRNVCYVTYPVVEIKD